MNKLIENIKSFLDNNDGEIYLADEKISFPANIRKVHGLNTESVQAYIWAVKLVAYPERIEVVDYNGKCLDVTCLDDTTVRIIHSVMVKRKKEMKTIATGKDKSKSESISPEAYRKLLVDAYRLLKKASRMADNAEDSMYRRLNTGYTNLEDKSRQLMAEAVMDARKALRILDMVADNKVDFGLDG